MTPPRFYARRRSWWVSRETLMGCFRLPPDAETTGITQFLLVYAAKKSKVELHGYSALPNRTGMTVTDRDGESGMTDFLRTFHQLMATHLGHRHQRTPGPFWCPSGLELRCLKGPKAILKALVDSLVAPAEADLCERPGDWPGLISRVETVDGARITIPRPPQLDRPGTVLPEELTFRLTRPPGFESMTRPEFRAMLRAEVARRMQQILARRRSGVADIDELRDRDILARPDGPPIRRDTPREEQERLLRHVEADTPDEQIAAAAELRAFRAAHREAFEEWQSGNRRVEFPHGTWAMVRLHRARARPPHT